MTDEPTRQPETVEKDAFLRVVADFDNYRKRMEHESAEAAKFICTGVVLDVVDAMDHLERAIDHAPPAVQNESDWYGGLAGIGKEFLKKLKKFGVERVKSVEKSFDPATMEAVQMVEGGPSQTVQSEVRAGYTLHGRVIRPARVVVYR